jgi:hypothetical protein
MRIAILHMALMILLVNSSAAAQSPLGDPQIPDGERIVFRVSLGDESYTMETHVARMTVGEEEVYQITNVSEDEQVTIELVPSDMTTRSVRTLGDKDGIRFETVTRIEPNGNSQLNRVEAVNLNDLMVKLRGFDFSSVEELTVKFVTGTRGNDKSFEPRLTQLRDERLKIGSRRVDAHKLELVFSAPRMWRTLGLIPRTFFWYDTEMPHVLLRVENTEVPGSPRWLLEVVDYSGW